MLRLIHITFGLIWAGGAITAGFFVYPSVVAAGPAGGVVMDRFVGERRFPAVMTACALITILAGLRLYMLKFSVAWALTPEGIVLTVGGLLAIAGLFIGSMAQAPAAMKLQALGAEVAALGAPPAPEKLQELEALRARTKKLGIVLAVHLGAATVLMACTRLAQMLS